MGAANYNDAAYAAGSTQPAAFARQAEIAQSSHDNAQISHDNSAIALQAKDLAVAAAEQAAASVNFLGFWSDQTGPAAKGVSVKHNNRIWRSVEAIPDITLVEPGVSPAWTTGDGGTVVQRATADTLMSPGVLYVAAVPGLLFTAPATLLLGDQLMLSNATNERIFMAFGGHTVKGQTPDAPMAIPRQRGFLLTYDGSTLA